MDNFVIAALQHETNKMKIKSEIESMSGKLFLTARLSSSLQLLLVPPSLSFIVFANSSVDS